MEQGVASSQLGDEDPSLGTPAATLAGSRKAKSEGRGAGSPQPVASSQYVTDWTGEIPGRLD